jgi:hypothetical protein
MNVKDTIEYNGGNIVIWYDEDPPNPRLDWDNFGTMFCLHRSYTLGDFHKRQNAYSTLRHPELARFREPGEFDEWWWENGSGGVILPLYLYDHSGITISTKPFSCQWDSGQVGYIFATRATIYKDYGYKRVTKQRLQKVIKHLETEVEVYDQYLTGGFVGFTATLGEHEEQVGGYDDADYAVQEAKDLIDGLKEKVA